MIGSCRGRPRSRHNYIDTDASAYVGGRTVSWRFSQRNSMMDRHSSRRRNPTKMCCAVRRSSPYVFFLQAACHHGSRRSNDYAAAYLLLVRAHQYGVGEDQVPKRLLDEDHVYEPHHQLGIHMYIRGIRESTAGQSIPEARASVRCSSPGGSRGRRGGSTGGAATRRACPGCAPAAVPPCRTGSLGGCHHDRMCARLINVVGHPWVLEMRHRRTFDEGFAGRQPERVPLKLNLAGVCVRQGNV